MIDEILYSKADGVATLILNAPDRLNALTVSMARSLTEACTDAADDQAIGAFVILANGRAFCAGADLATLEQVADDPLGTEEFAAVEHIYRAFLSVESLPVPVIAGINGAAVGAGFNLALAADVRIADESARLMSGFLKKGLHPGGGHFDLIARATSVETAVAMGLLGETISGHQLVERGLAWEVVPADQLRARVQELASRASISPELARAAKASLQLTTGSRDQRAAAVQIERVQQLRSVRWMRASKDGQTRTPAR